MFSGAVEGRDEAYVAPLSAKFPVLGRKIPFERRCAEHLCIAASIHGVLSGKRHSACRAKGAATYNYCLGRFPIQIGLQQLWRILFSQCLPIYLIRQLHYRLRQALILRLPHLFPQIVIRLRPQCRPAQPSCHHQQQHTNSTNFLHTRCFFNVSSARLPATPCRQPATVCTIFFKSHKFNKL